MCVFSNRCRYSYDPFGNLFQKNCTTGGSRQYLVDPFGLFGGDIIAEVRGNTIEINMIFLASFFRCREMM